jgi:tRNA dimethylallyltransferase
MSLPRVVCLVGPTATGKTALALEVAERLGAEIVSADSRQLYRSLDVGTAKPTAAERARVPHHCLDLVDPDALFDAARFRGAAAAAIDDVRRRGRPVLVVGGTGLYVRALLGGLCAAPPRAPALRAALARKLEERGPVALHRGLAALDPAAAARIAPRDTVRVVRALEVGLATGMPLSAWQARHRFAAAPYDALVVGLTRPTPELDARLAARAREMVAAGFLDEVRALRARGLGADAPGLRAVGYREMLACVEGRLAPEAALAATVRATRRLAKRQRTWFRREPGIRWRHPERDRALVAEEIAEFLGAS